MEWIATALLVVLIGIALPVAILLLTLEERIPWQLGALLGVCWMTGVVAFGLYSIDKRETKGPCVKYETQMHYNPALKMVMPAKVCVLRGEWVK